MAEHSNEGHGSGGGGAGRWVFWGFLAVAAYFLLTEHQAHVINYLPFILLLACPLMHLFHGHGGHGGHRDESAGTGNDAKKPPAQDAGEANSKSGRHHH